MKFKKFSIGLIVFVLTFLFIIFFEMTLNKPPKMPSYSNYYSAPTYNYNTNYNSNNYYNNYNYNYNSNSSNYSSNSGYERYEKAMEDYNNQVKKHKVYSLIIQMILSILIFAATFFLLSTSAISYGLLAASFMGAIYSLSTNPYTIKASTSSIITGLALAAILAISYFLIKPDGTTSANARPTEPGSTPGNPLDNPTVSKISSDLLPRPIPPVDRAKSSDMTINMVSDPMPQKSPITPAAEDKTSTPSAGAMYAPTTPQSTSSTLFSPIGTSQPAPATNTAPATQGATSAASTPANTPPAANANSASVIKIKQ